MNDRGRRWLGEIGAAGLLVGAGLKGLAPYGSAAYPPSTAAAARVHGVALADPGATPPRGRVGVWTDGAGRAELVALAPDGQRLFRADDGDGVERTNASELMGDVFVVAFAL